MGRKTSQAGSKKKLKMDGRGCSFKMQPPSGTGTPCVTHLSGCPCTQPRVGNQNCPSLAPGRQSATYQVKLLLQLFVGVIDAELFKAVDIKGLKTETQLVEQIKMRAGTGARCSLALTSLTILNVKLSSLTTAIRRCAAGKFKLLQSGWSLIKWQPVDELPFPHPGCSLEGI